MAKRRTIGVSMAPEMVDKLVRMADASGMRMSRVIEVLVQRADESQFRTPIMEAVNER
jgi:hypothetical protein